MAASTLVIKVKFGETLRRLTASIHGNALSLNIFMLKEKIRHLLCFGSNVAFTMTYVDEDGDVVILATEDDLRDTLRQSLNPLKITVNLSNGTPVGSSVGTTSAQLQQQFLQRQLQQLQLRQQQQHLQQQTLQQQFRQNFQLQQQQSQNHQAINSQVSGILSSESDSSDSDSSDGSANLESSSFRTRDFINLPIHDVSLLEE